MRRRSLAQLPCPIARGADQLGDTWTLVLLREVWLGKHRFAEFQRALPIAPNMLTRRLADLRRHGLLEARKAARHSEYHLTPKGEDTLPVLLSLATWANRWLSPRGEVLTIVDGRSQKRLEPVVVDARSGRRLVAGQVGVMAGPGAPKAVRTKLNTPVLFKPAPEQRKST